MNEFAAGGLVGFVMGLICGIFFIGSLMLKNKHIGDDDE